MLVSCMNAQVEASNAEEVGSSHAQLPETKEPEHTSAPDDDVSTPIAVVSAAPSMDSGDASLENVNQQSDVQPHNQDVQSVDNSTPVEQMEMSPVKQPTAEEEVVVTEVRDDTEAAPMDISNVMLPINEQIEQIAESATAMPESSVAVQSDISVTVQSDISAVVHPEVTQKVPQKKVFSQQIEAPAKSKVAIEQPVAPPSREPVTRQPMAPLQKSQPQVTEIKQEKKQELVCVYMCV